jgi:hypothetical protein
VSALGQIECELDRFAPQREPLAAAQRLVELAEAVLEHWIVARGDAPTDERKEGFRLLALHRQGTRDAPSFNACRESCREIAYHYNLIAEEPDSPLAEQRQRMMALLTRHVLLFVSGKMQTDRLGEFCCASRPLRLE